MADIHWVDILTLALYFVVVMAVGLTATCFAQRGSAKGFFLAGKSMKWYTMGGSIFAANVGAPMFIGLAGTAAATGLAPVMFEWHAVFMLIILGWIFVPVYIASGSYTMPEYLSKRFGGTRIRVYFAIIQLIMQILMNISAEVYAGTVFVRLILGWELYSSVCLILAITAIYSIGGGLSALIYTDTLQTATLVIGSAVLAVISLMEVGGISSLKSQYMKAASDHTYLTHAMHHNLSCGFPPDDAFRLFRSVDSDYPWPGLVVGLTILAMYYWCANQAIVQRNLSAKTVSHSKAACVMASYLKLLPFFLFVIPGMVARVLFPQEVGCSDPETCKEICSNPSGCSNIAYPLLVLKIMPRGFKGLMLAALMAALMSSLAAAFTSSSSVFTLDIYKRFRPHASDKEQVIIGRLFGLVLIGVSIAWLPMLEEMQGSQLWNYIQSVSAYITPPWVVIFILGIFWNRTTERGAWWGLIVGLAGGLTRIGIHFAYGTPFCGEPNQVDKRPPILTKIHYLHFAIILAALTAIVTVAVSFMTEPRAPEKLRKRTWWSRHAVEDPEESDDETPGPVSKHDEKEKSQTLRFIDWICGFSKKQQGTQLTKEEQIEQDKAMTSIKENPKWARLCNINGVIIIAITTFLLAFWG